MSKKLLLGLTIAVASGIGTYAFGHMGEGYGNYGSMMGYGSQYPGSCGQ